MTESIPVSLVTGWITELKSVLKEAGRAEKGADRWINKGMRHGVGQIQHKIETWIRHQENMEALNLSGAKFLITKDVDSSGGRYKKREGFRQRPDGSIT